MTQVTVQIFSISLFTIISIRIYHLCYNKLCNKLYYNKLRNKFIMFLVYCKEDRSYLIVEENKAIFEDGDKKDDEIQFFHSNKMYTGCVIRCVQV